MTVEYSFPGGIYPPNQEGRADITLRETGSDLPMVEGTTTTFELSIVSGNGVFSLVEIPPRTLLELGKWLQRIAEQVVGQEETC